MDSKQIPWPDQDKRFGVYGNGFYKDSFDTHEEACAYVHKWKLFRYEYICINDAEEYK